MALPPRGWSTVSSSSASSSTDERQRRTSRSTSTAGGGDGYDMRAVPPPVYYPNSAQPDCRRRRRRRRRRRCHRHQKRIFADPPHVQRANGEGSNSSTVGHRHVSAVGSSAKLLVTNIRNPFALSCRILPVQFATLPHRRNHHKGGSNIIFSFFFSRSVAFREHFSQH